MPVPLLFKNSTTEKTVIVDATSNNQEFRVSLGFVPDTVIVDPEYWLISANNSSEKEPYTGTGTVGIDVYPNPAIGPVSIFVHDFEGAEVSMALYNSIGQVMWRSKQALINGTSFIQLNMANMAGGVYYLRARSSNGNTLLKKILK